MGARWVAPFFGTLCFREEPGVLDCFSRRKVDGITRRCSAGGTTQLRKMRSIAPVLNAVLLTENIEAQMGNTFWHAAVLPAIRDQVFRLNSRAAGE